MATVTATDNVPRPYSRSKTTYGNMNSWAKKQNALHSAREPAQSGSFAQTVREPSRSDDYYHRYLQLSANMAEKHPKLGEPRERQGRIGGSWRHIKEVLGYTGSQVCFVDGLVSLYDTEQAQSGRQGPGWRSKMSGPTGYSAHLARENSMAAGPSYELSAQHSPLTGQDNKYKGFYTLKK